MNWLHRLRHTMFLLAARALSTPRWHDIALVSVESRPFVSKRRRWLSTCAIPLANWVLRLDRAGTRVLPERAWIQREFDLHRRQGGERPRMGPRGALWLPIRAGRSLSEWLLDSDLQLERKLVFVEAAARALAELHTFRNGDSLAGLTHGDATTRNVMVAPDTGMAVWIDFDTAHRESASEEWRRADDLRALTCSAATSIPKEGYGNLVRAIAIGYRSPATLERLAEQVDRLQVRPRLFPFAQAPLEWSRLASLRDEIIRFVSDHGGRP